MNKNKNIKYKKNHTMKELDSSKNIIPFKNLKMIFIVIYGTNEKEIYTI